METLQNPLDLWAVTNDAEIVSAYNNQNSSVLFKSINVNKSDTLINFDAKAVYYRSKAMAEFFDLIDNNAIQRNSQGNPYTEREIIEAEASLKKNLMLAKEIGLTPGSTLLLDTFINQSFNRKEVKQAYYTDKGNLILQFDENSDLGQSLKNNMALNRKILISAYKRYLENGRPSEPLTDIESISFYSTGIDIALSEGQAISTTTFIVDSINHKIKANIIIFDDWDHDKLVANLGSFYRDAYILQQSGAKKVFGQFVNYEVEFPLEFFAVY